ncbi:MAG: hypothetical protein GY869_06170 [Planctomycetes bacterium]|nr:hypothetical protein [Planctomycetota bacterium]
MTRSIPKLLIALTVALIVCGLTLTANAQQIQSASEQSGFQEYTSHEDMLDFMQKIQASSTEMLLSDFGKTIEGRIQPYAVFSRPLITQPWEALASGKPIVALVANVHGGERTLRESLLLLTREFATPGTEANNLLDDIIVIVAPSINIDGFVRGSRGNAQGIDMNRDYIKLEQPALYNYVHNIVHLWHPHVAVDGHNGGSFPYNVTYQGPSNASPDQRLTEMCDYEIFPFMDEKMEDAGYLSFYYSGGNETRWNGGGSDPRIGRNYLGLTNTVGILFESPGGQDREIGAKSGHVAYKSICQYTADQADAIVNLVNSARSETVKMGQNAEGDIPVQMEYAAQDFKVSYQIAQGRGEDRILIDVTDADLMTKPVTTKSRPRPYAYILEPRAHKAIDMLKRHRILVEVLTEEVELDIEAYEAVSISRRSEYDHPAAVTIALKDDTVKRSQTFPAGSFVVRTGQVMGRVVAHMLEPETNDNVIRWNTMDAILPRVPTPEQLAQQAEQQTEQQAGQRGQQRAGQRAGQHAGQRAGMPQRGGQRGGAARQAIVPIFKIMTPKELPTMILKYN